MRTLLLQTWHELRLLAKLRWTLLLPPAAGAWMLVQCIGFRESPSHNLNVYAADAHNQIMMFISAVPILLGVLLIRRDALHASYEWSLALPVTNRVMIAAKWIAGFLYVSSFTLCIQAVYAALALHVKLPWPSIRVFLANYSALYEMSLAVSVALGLVLGALMPLRFSLPVAFCGWVFGSLFVPLALIGSYGWYPAQAFSLDHLLLLANGEMNEVWLPALMRREYGYLLAFAAAFGLFMLTAAGALLAKARPVRHPKLPAIIMLLALLLSAAVYYPYGQLWSDRFARLRQLQAAAQEDIRPQEPYRFRIDSLKLDATRLPDGTIAFNTVIRLPTKDGQPVPADPKAKRVLPRIDGRVSFLLDPLLQVRSLEVDGKPADWQRTGELVSFDAARLQAGGEDHTVALRYDGVIDEWLKSYDTQSYRAFVKGKNVFLPAYAGWYPLPGGSGLGYTRHGAYFVDMNAAAGIRADFDITLRGFEGPLMATIDTAKDDHRPGTRHFVQQSAEAPYVLGGDFERVGLQGEPAEIVTTPDNAAESRRGLAALHKMEASLSGWIGKEAAPASTAQIFYMPLSQLFPWSGDSSFAAGNAYFFQAAKYSAPLEYRLQLVMSRQLFGDTIGVNENVNRWEDYHDPINGYSLVQTVRRLILLSWQSDLWANPNLVPSEDFPYAETMRRMISDAVAEGDTGLVKRVLKRFYDKGLRIERMSAEQVAGGTITEENRFRFPKITWNDWLAVWKEEEGR